MNDAAERIGYRRDRCGAGGPGRRLPPAASRPAPSTILEANARPRGQLADPVGFPPPVHPRATRRTARLAVPRSELVVPERRMRWVTTSRRTPRGSRCRSRPGCRWTACRSRTADTWCQRAIVASRPTTWWWPPAGIRSPVVPGFAGELDPGIVQLHSSEYLNQRAAATRRRVGRRRGELRSRGRPGIRARPRDVALGPRPGSHPVPHRGDRLQAPARTLGDPLPLLPGARRRAHPIGRKVKPRFLSKGGPLIRIKPKEIAAAGVERVPAWRGCAMVSRCSRTAGSSRPRTSCGARGSATTSPGSTSLRSATASHPTIEGS